MPRATRRRRSSNLRMSYDCYSKVEADGAGHVGRVVLSVFAVDAEECSCGLLLRPAGFRSSSSAVSDTSGGDKRDDNAKKNRHLENREVPRDLHGA